MPTLGMFTIFTVFMVQFSMQSVTCVILKNTRNSINIIYNFLHGRINTFNLILNFNFTASFLSWIFQRKLDRKDNIYFYNRPMVNMQLYKVTCFTRPSSKHL